MQKDFLFANILYCHQSNYIYVSLGVRCFYATKFEITFFWLGWLSSLEFMNLLYFIENTTNGGPIVSDVYFKNIDSSLFDLYEMTLHCHSYGASLIWQYGLSSLLRKGYKIISMIGHKPTNFEENYCK